MCGFTCGSKCGAVQNARNGKKTNIKLKGEVWARINMIYWKCFIVLPHQKRRAKLTFDSTISLIFHHWYIHSNLPSITSSSWNANVFPFSSHHLFILCLFLNANASDLMGDYIKAYICMHTCSRGHSPCLNTLGLCIINQDACFLLWWSPDGSAWKKVCSFDNRRSVKVSQVGYKRFKTLVG